MELGLSEYEGKAYLALLARNPATAYETAHGAGIPTSKIYEVMGKMLARGLVLVEDEGGERKRYVPLDAKDFVSGERSRIGETIDRLEEDLKDFEGSLDVSYLWNVRDRESLLERARAILSRTEKEVLLSAATEELESLAPALSECAARGRRLATVRFGEKPMEIPGAVYPHPIRDTLQAEKGGRGFALVSDSREALIGTISSTGGSTQGAYSRNKGFVVLAEDYVKHDIYITKIVERFDSQLIERFGEGYALLRDVFSDTER
jgi:sugar-specific transcriptional regulator TrmB